MKPSWLPASIGRYEVIDRLGTGGMGAVFRARDPSIGRIVAIKMLHADDDEMRERFLHEAQSVGALTHRNIVTVYDFGDHDGQPYIVMEFVEGRTLADEIRTNQERPLSSKLELIEALALALDHAHERGIVHRDVKPANLMIDRAGVLKILDFGIARVGNSALTQAGVLMGTPHYMSPEQIEGAPVDRRSDVFAVGLVMYELLTYQKAFAGDTPPVVMHRILRDPPPPIVRLCPWLDPDVVAVVERALRKEPAQRYQRLAEMAADLRGARERLSGLARLERPTVMLPPTPAPPAPVARPPIVSAPFRLRADRLEAHLQTAQAAFDAGDFAAAAAECEQAVPIAPDDQRLFDLLTRATEAIARQQVRHRVEAARQHQSFEATSARAATPGSGAAPLPAMAPTDQDLIDPYDLRSNPLERPLTRVGLPSAPPTAPHLPPTRSRRRPLAVLAVAAAIAVAALGVWRRDDWVARWTDWVGPRADPAVAAATDPLSIPAPTASVPPGAGPLPRAAMPEDSIAPAVDVRKAPSSPSPLPPPMTESEATDLLNRYNAAYARFDLARLRQLYPALPVDHAATVQADEATTRSCVHTFSNIRISGTPAEPRLETLALKVCAPMELQQEIRERQHHVFELRRNPDGSLIIARHTR
jgi:serine/threonine-protein kinase